jgi:hypothetical protein
MSITNNFPKLILVGIFSTILLLYFSISQLKTKDIDLPITKTKPIEYFNKTLYRGMCEDHSKYSLGEKGIAEPYGGHDNPISHMHGSNNSIFTSFTTDFKIGFMYSVTDKMGNPSNGLMLIYNTGKLPINKVFDMLQIAGDYYAESEFLVAYRLVGCHVLYTYANETWQSAYHRAINMGYIGGQ